MVLAEKPVPLVSRPDTLAQRISEQAPLAAEGLRAVADNTSMIPALDSVNTTAVNVLEDCQAARAALGG